MASRNDRRRFTREVCSGLRTYLLDPGTLPSLAPGLLRNAALTWIGNLDHAERDCIVCASRMTNRRDVGFVLLATPATAKPSPLASCSGVCRECAELPLCEIERAATVELRQAIPRGEFEPLMLPTIH